MLLQILGDREGSEEWVTGGRVTRNICHSPVFRGWLCDTGSVMNSLLFCRSYYCLVTYTVTKSAH